MLTNSETRDFVFGSKASVLTHAILRPALTSTISCTNIQLGNVCQQISPNNINVTVNQSFALRKDMPKVTVYIQAGTVVTIHTVGQNSYINTSQKNYQGYIDMIYIRYKGSNTEVKNT